MNALRSLITDLEGARGHPLRQGPLIMDFLLDELPEADRALFVAALDAAAVLRYFDRSLLTRVVCGFDYDSDLRWSELCELPFVRSFGTDTSGRFCLQETFRRGWRARLASRDPDYFRALALRCAEVLKATDSWMDRSEALYHRLSASNAVAGETLPVLGPLVIRGLPVDTLPGLRAGLNELLEANLVAESVRPDAVLLVEALDRRLGHRADREVSEALVSRAIERMPGGASQLFARTFWNEVLQEYAEDDRLEIADEGLTRSSGDRAVGGAARIEIEVPRISRRHAMATNLVVGLEIGTATIRAVAGEVGEDGTPKVLGVGQCASRGVRKGEVLDATLAAEDVRDALVELEQSAGIEVRTVCLGVTGGHVRSRNQRGVHAVVSAEGEITDQDVQDVLRNARSLALPDDQYVLHYVRQEFEVDGQSGIANPAGLLGRRLEVGLHVIHARRSRLQNAIRVVTGLQIEVEGIVFNGIASALAVLSPELKERGSLVIDLGAGTTEFAAFTRGSLRHSGVLAVGGDHVTNDLAVCLKVPSNRAEELKRQPGDRAEDASGGRGPVADLPGKSINLDHLRQVMTLRLEETLEIIREEIREAGLEDSLSAGVFLCGGGTRAAGLRGLADKIFPGPASVGRASALKGLPPALDQPEMATVLGLLKFGAHRVRRRPGLKAGIRESQSVHPSLGWATVDVP